MKTQPFNYNNFLWNSFRKNTYYPDICTQVCLYWIWLWGQNCGSGNLQFMFVKLALFFKKPTFRYSKSQTSIASGVTTTISIEFHNWNCNSSTFNIPMKKPKTVKKMKRKTICIRITRANQDVTNFWGFPSDEVSPFKLCTCETAVERKRLLKGNEWCNEDETEKQVAKIIRNISPSPVV